MSLVEASEQQFAYTYWGFDTNMLEDRLRELISRGAVIDSASIAYGPSPARIHRTPGADEASWCVIVIVRWPNGEKEEI